MGGRSGGGGRSRSSNRSSSRGSIFSRSSGSSSYSYSSPRTLAVPPASATPTTHTVKVEQPGFFSNVMQGFSHGTGQSIAFNLFKPFQSSGSSSNNTVPAPATASPAKELPREYVQCMKEYDNKKDLCKQYLDDTDN